MSALAERYARAFRIWPMRQDKTPKAPGFGADHPEATWDPKRIPEGAPVGILCGPLAGEFKDCGYHVLGLDLDKAMDRAKLEDALGCALPPTLESKGARHLYYLIPDDHQLHQRNKAITCEGGALDIRPTAGGYLIEKDQWDRGFDPGLMVELPAQALAKLTQYVGEHSAGGHEPRELAPVQLSDRDAEIARELASIWQHSTTGDRAFGGLGGWLARRGVSRDRAEAIAGRIAELTESTHTDPCDRVAQGYEDGGCPLGRPSLADALSETQDEALVETILQSVEDAIRYSVEDFRPKAEAGGPKKRGMLQLVPAAELAQPLGPVPWLVEALDFAPGRPMVIGGAAGSGKTYALQDLAIAVASGTEVWGAYPCRQGAVLHVDVDQGRYATTMRYQLLANGRDIKLAELPLACAFFDFAMSSKGVINPKAVDALREACTGRALCIIDSLRGVAPGLDEQDSSFGEVLQMLSKISSETECAFAVVAHSGHEQDRARGTSAIQDRAGSIFQLTYVPQEGGEGHVNWRQTKRSEYGQGRMLQFDTIMDREPKGTDLQTTISVKPEQASPNATSPARRAQDMILAALEKFPTLSHNQLVKVAKGSGLGTTKANELIADLVECKKVSQSRAGSQSFSYTLLHGSVENNRSGTDGPDHPQDRLLGSVGPRGFVNDYAQDRLFSKNTGEDRS